MHSGSELGYIPAVSVELKLLMELALRSKSKLKT